MCSSRGSVAIEYALIAGLIALAIVAAVQNIGSQVKTMFDSVVF